MFQNQMQPKNQALSDSQKLEMLKTGTTTIGIVIKDGVILATESQATAGFFCRQSATAPARRDPLPAGRHQESGAFP